MVTEIFSFQRLKSLQFILLYYLRLNWSDILVSRLSISNALRHAPTSKLCVSSRSEYYNDDFSVSYLRYIKNIVIKNESSSARSHEYCPNVCRRIQNK